MDKINVELSNLNDEIYFSSTDIISNLLNEQNIYPGSQKRLFLSEFLYAIKLADKQIGFISAINNPKYGDNVLLLDLCLLSKYRNKGIGDQALDLVIKDLHTKDLYQDKMLILETNKCNDTISVGSVIGDNLLKIGDIHTHRVVSSKKQYKKNKKNEKGK